MPYVKDLGSDYIGPLHRGIQAPGVIAAVNGLVMSVPTDGTTVASSTYASLGTPWTDEVSIGEGQAIKYDLRTSTQISTGRMYVALAVGGTIITRRQLYSGAGGVETNGILMGVYEPGVAGTYTFEVLMASDSAGTVTVNTTVDTTIDTSSTFARDSLSQLILEPVTVA